MLGIYYFHDTHTPEFVFRAHSSEKAQGVVNHMYRQLGLDNPPKVNLFKDPGHVYASYYICTETINVSEAALKKLPDYAWKAMIAHEIAHYYDTVTNRKLRTEPDDKANEYLDSNPTEMAADQLAAKLTSPQGVLRALQYCHAFYPQASDDARMGAMQNIIEKHGLRKDIKKNLLEVFKMRDQERDYANGSSSPSPTSASSSTTINSGGNSNSSHGSTAPSINANRKSKENKKQMLINKIMDTVSNFPSSSATSTPSGIQAVHNELKHRKYLENKIKSQVRAMDKKKRMSNQNFNYHV